MLGSMSLKILIITDCSDTTDKLEHQLRLNPDSIEVSSSEDVNINMDLSSFDVVLRQDAGKESLLTISYKRETSVIRMSEIMWIEKCKRKVRVVTKSEKVYEAYMTFAELLAKLDSRFCRCHNSFVVNLDEVRKVSGRKLIMSDDNQIPIGSKYVNMIRNENAFRREVSK